VLLCVAVCYSVQQCVAVCCSVLQSVAGYCSVLQCIIVCCKVLQCAAVPCSVPCVVSDPCPRHLAPIHRHQGVEDSNKTTMHMSQRELAHEEETRVGGEEAGTRGGARQERETLLLAYCCLHKERHCCLHMRHCCLRIVVVKRDIVACILFQERETLLLAYCCC